MKVKLIWQILVLIIVLIVTYFFVYQLPCLNCQTPDNSPEVKPILSAEKQKETENNIKKVEPNSVVSTSSTSEKYTTSTKENIIEDIKTETIKNEIVEKNNDFIKSIRLDLSSVSIPKNQDAYIKEITEKLQFAGVNTVYISPWSDGLANYDSKLAGKSKFGNESFIEKFITSAHQKNIQVFAWFVIGKDNFPSQTHPEWFAKTKSGKNYYHADEPGVNLPFASLANQEYINYHLALLRETGALQFDGWVISEPLIGWGDMYDNYYTDFSSSITKSFTEQTNINPLELFNESSKNYYEKSPSLYQKWIDLRAQTVTKFVASSMSVIKEKSTKPIIITLFTEPGSNGRLVSLNSLKEWLGQDINAISKLNPNYFEIQSLWADFEYPQTPSWTNQMISEFQSQINFNTKLLVSVQGFGINANDFSTAISSAKEKNIYGISTYAYHTLSQTHWQALRDIWFEK